MMARLGLVVILLIGFCLSVWAAKNKLVPTKAEHLQNLTMPELTNPKKLIAGYVFDVTVSTAQELDVVLNRADSLRELFNPQQHGRIAIVLHGDELQLF
jgi:hypothetical protein